MTPHQERLHAHCADHRPNGVADRETGHTPGPRGGSIHNRVAPLQ
jgi:hypothetical protein